MAKYKYTWQVEFYGENCIIRNIYVDAKTRQEALAMVKEKHKIVELITCRRVDTY